MIDIHCITVAEVAFLCESCDGVDDLWVILSPLPS